MSLTSTAQLSRPASVVILLLCVRMVAGCEVVFPTLIEAVLALLQHTVTSLNGTINVRSEGRVDLRR